jgi:hypothetical protein
MQAHTQPLFITDFLMVREVFALADARGFVSFGEVIWHRREVLALLIPVVVLLSINFKFHLAKPWPRPTRIITGIAGLLAFIIFFWSMSFANLPFYTNITQLYRHNGLLVSLIHSFYISRINPPSQRFDITALREFLNPHLSLASPSAEVILPDILVIMNESFLDLGGNNSQLSTRDLLSRYHWFGERGLRGTMTSPVFGGNTSNAEFELLTGHRNDFLPPTLQAYVYFVRGQTFAVPWSLAQHGYRSVAYHPFHPDFWNRDVIYPRFGFDDFIAGTAPFGEEFVERSVSFLPILENERGGRYTTDVVAVRRVVNDLAIAVENEAEPQFKFLVTIQNHGPYDNPNLFTDEEREAVAAPLLAPFDFTDREELILSNFLLNLAGANRSLDLLHNYLTSPQARPTIVVFFSDHQPWLIDNQEVFTTLGMDAGDGQPPPNSQVSFFIWANYFDVNAASQPLLENLPTDHYWHIYDLMPLTYQLLGWDLPDYWQLSRHPQLRSQDMVLNLPWQSAQYNLLFENASQFNYRTGNLLP